MYTKSPEPYEPEKTRRCEATKTNDLGIEEREISKAEILDILHKHPHFKKYYHSFLIKDCLAREQARSLKEYSRLRKAALCETLKELRSDALFRELTGAEKGSRFERECLETIL